jgi:hypothetical protein
VSSVLYASQDLTVSSSDSCRMLLLFKFNYKTLEEALFCLFLNRPYQCNSLSPDSIHKFYISISTLNISPEILTLQCRSSSKLTSRAYQWRLTSTMRIGSMFCR